MTDFDSITHIKFNLEDVVEQDSESNSRAIGFFRNQIHAVSFYSNPGRADIDDMHIERNIKVFKMAAAIAPKHAFWDIDAQVD